MPNKSWKSFGRLYFLLPRGAKMGAHIGYCSILVIAEKSIEGNDGKRVFWMVKAIHPSKACLNNHGAREVKPDTIDTLAALYPAEQTLGYKVGEVREMSSLCKKR